MKPCDDNKCQIWRNCRWGRDSSYLKEDEVEWNFPKLWKLLKLYDEAFDDHWWYRRTGKGYVIRQPLWATPHSGSYWEDKDERQPQFQTLEQFTEAEAQ